MGMLTENFTLISELKRKIKMFYLEHAFLLPFALFYLQARLRSKSSLKIYFYPKRPSFYYVIFQICRFSGIGMIDNPEDADIIFRFEDTTFAKDDSVIQRLNKEKRMVNFGCLDISKKKVEEVHIRVYGYGSFVDPKKFNGRYIRKNDLNSLHDAVILDKPEKPREGFIYQKLINNIVEGEAEELRVPIFADNIPFVYIKHRPAGMRFTDVYPRAQIVKAEHTLTKNEYLKIIGFAKEIKLDCGEIDVLRDNDDGKIYIVDVNNTPVGPAFSLSLAEKRRALKLMSEAFHNAFL